MFVIEFIKVGLLKNKKPCVMNRGTSIDSDFERFQLDDIVLIAFSDAQHEECIDYKKLVISITLITQSVIDIF